MRGRNSLVCESPVLHILTIWYHLCIRKVAGRFAMPTFRSSLRDFARQRVPFAILILLAISFLTSCGNTRTIVNGKDESEANEIIVLLNTKGIDAQKVKSADSSSGGGQQKTALWDITVPNDKAIVAMSILNEAGLPRRRSQNLLNIFQETGLVPTDMAEKIRYQAGLGSQISNTIRTIDGVLDADVIISYPEEDPLHPDAPKKDITASVFVKHNGVLDDPNSHLASKIKSLVASSVAGLKYDNVTLIPVRARFSDYSTQSLAARSGEEKQYVNVWGITVAKDSLFIFRILFFSFCILILVLILVLVWIGWKIYPFMKESGGILELLHLKPLSSKVGDKQEKKPQEKKKKEKKEPEDEHEESLADESADFSGDIDVSEDER